VLVTVKEGTWGRWAYGLVMLVLLSRQMLGRSSTTVEIRLSDADR